MVGKRGRGRPKLENPKERVSLRLDPKIVAAYAVFVDLHGRYRYRFLVVPDQRQLMLLEEFAVGSLCPADIGLHQAVV